MPARLQRQIPIQLPGILLFVLLATLWLAGGASRADTLGQVVVRAVAWLLLIASLLLGRPVSVRQFRPVFLLLLAMIGLVVLQLVPLPPDVWMSLPGRSLFAAGTAAVGEPAPWRPLAIVPGAAMNALGSLIVPLAALMLISSLSREEQRWLPGFLLAVIVVSTLVGLLQFSGVRLNNIFVNDTPGHVNGTFANRNHFALLIAIGCVLAPAWALADGRRPEWRGPLALGLTLLFLLTILASGSRAGMLLGVFGLAFGLLLARHELRRSFRRAPRWALPAAVLLVIGIFAAVVLIGLAAGRTESITRVFSVELAADMRARGLPTVLAMIREYFPWGSGVGGFDPLFRLHEPFGLLKIHYFNHAHNDFLEVALDAGLPGLVILVVALGWWAVASIRVWRTSSDGQNLKGRLGSAVLFLVFVASIFDYPARTPFIMAVIVIAAAWLCSRPEDPAGPALRSAAR